MSPEIESINDLVQRLLSGLVVNSKDIELVVKGSDKSALVDVRCNAADCQKVIGKQGSHFKAIGLIAELAADHLDVVYKLRSLLPSVVGEASVYHRQPFVYNPNWPKAEIEKLLIDVLRMTTGQRAIIKHEQDQSYARMTVDIEADEGLLDELRTPINKLFNSIGIANGVAIIVDI
jgi:predicted RNA-binding protein YlqC (UPF0109 family)